MQFDTHSRSQPRLTQVPRKSKVLEQMMLSKKRVLKRQNLNSKPSNVRQKYLSNKIANLKDFGNDLPNLITPLRKSSDMNKSQKQKNDKEKPLPKKKVAFNPEESIIPMPQLDKIVKKRKYKKKNSSNLGTESVPRLKVNKKIRTSFRPQTSYEEAKQELEGDEMWLDVLDSEVVRSNAEIKVKNIKKQPVKRNQKRQQSVKRSSVKVEKKIKKLKSRPVSRCDKRPETVQEQQKQADRQVKALLRKEMKTFAQSENLPNDNYMLDIYQEYIGSYHFNKRLEKRRLKELEKLNPKNEDYHEVVYNRKDHDYQLAGLISHQYDQTFFESSNSEKFNLLYKEIKTQLLSKYRRKYRQKIKKQLLSCANQLLVLYDTKVPRPIMSSVNQQTVVDKCSDLKPRMIGFAVFQETLSIEEPSLYVHRLMGVNRSKYKKKQVLFALKTTQQQLRAHEILISIDNRNLQLYLDFGFKISNKNRKDLRNVGVKKRDRHQVLSFETQLKSRDKKQDIKLLQNKDLSIKALKLKWNIDKMIKWLKKNEDKLNKSIKKQNRSKAAASDQAKTPKWLLARIKKFCHLTDEQIKDIFVYQENWSTKAFFDAYKKQWDKKIFHYINSPFTQIIHALKKCAEFQAEGGNCAMILPSVSIHEKDFFLEAIMDATVRQDLPLFAFEGFKDPLMKHIVLLYFLQPEFANDIITKNGRQEIDKVVIENQDETRYEIRHLPKRKTKGRKPRVITDEEKDEILSLYLNDKTIQFIKTKIQRRYSTVRDVLCGQLGDEIVEKVQVARSNREATDALYDFVQNNYTWE